jgi:hypothetical protein
LYWRNGLQQYAATQGYIAVTDRQPIRYVAASSWKDHVHYVLTRPDPHVEKLLPFLAQLLEQATEPSDQYRCPVCNHELEIEYGKWKGKPGQLQIQVNCARCNILISFESDLVPPWAKEFEFSALFQQLTRCRDDSSQSGS